MRKQIQLLVAAFLLVQPVWSQDPAEYQKWLKKQQDEFQEFRDARDKEFIQFLNLEWKQMKAFNGLVRDDKPKPTKPPVYQPNPGESPKADIPSGKDIPTRKPAHNPTGEKVPTDPPSTPNPGQVAKDNPPPSKEIPNPKPDIQPQSVIAPEGQPTLVRQKEPVQEIHQPTKDLPASRPEEKPKLEITSGENPPSARPNQPTKNIVPAASDVRPVKPEEKPKPEPEEKQPSVSLKKDEHNITSGQPAQFDFFGVTSIVASGIEQKPKLGKEISKESISAFWAGLSKTEYDHVVSDLASQRSRLGLNDWGYCQFVYRWSKQFYSGGRNEAVLMTWFLLAKSGFDARVGYSQGQIYLLLPTANNLFYISYYMIGKDDKKYYAVPLEGVAKRIEGVLYSYDGSYPGVEKTTDFTVKSAPVLNDQVGKRVLKFEYGRRTYIIPVEFNKDAVSFFENYPLTDIGLYFGSSPSSEAARSLVAGLKPIVSGKSETEAANILLRFVQTAFEYQTDEEQFGREKPFFPDETLYYPYSDCEDRAVLFAFLVRKVIGLDVVGLDYPSHIATAVRFTGNVDGDAVTYKGRRYVICDPTYIYADIGNCMPQFKTVNPNIITFNN